MVATADDSFEHLPAPPQGRRALALASLGALGVVYGDIGTSPLYAMKECLAFPKSPHAIHSTAATLEHNVLGVTSLMLWALILVVTIKYLVFVLRADNKGEGGILALAALVLGTGGRARGLALPLLLGLFGAGLLFGDGAITPAISILGAMEGLSEHSPRLAHLVVPITVAIIVGLFLVQRHGPGTSGVAFGPVMLVWFIAIGLIGLRWIFVEPSVLRAINPAYGVTFLFTHGIHGYLLLGLVFLVVTGGEALYADMGHFGKRPIRIAWFAAGLPGLILNYFGQAALFLTSEPGSITNPFYGLVEGPLQIPMLVLATLAAIIASQALISGVFSLTRQAMQLGFWPRVTVVHTSASNEGQIFIPEMNWLLMASCIILVLQFKSSSGLAAAYGIAVTGTMAITTYLFFLVCRRRWHYSLPRALSFTIPFLVIDLAFFTANAAKIADGGWIPLVIGMAVFAVMTTWSRGRHELAKALGEGSLPEDLFFTDIAAHPPPRVRGTAVFMSSAPQGIPNVLVHHMKHNPVLHEQVVLFSLQTAPVPYVDIPKKLIVRELGHGFYRVTATVGFMQTPDVPRLLSMTAPRGIVTSPMTTTYYLGRQTLLTTGTTKLARWRKLLFTFLARNARPPTAFFHLPPNRVAELGVQIEL
ncbi:MAG: KUP/HAK/KT family potassium transporter [Kofleriaceae bacterium]|nr:KUP/HAK/KT family potassium transporter [Kofleriaceae bacterium]